MQVLQENRYAGLQQGLAALVQTLLQRERIKQRNADISSIAGWVQGGMGGGFPAVGSPDLQTLALQLLGHRAESMMMTPLQKAQMENYQVETAVRRAELPAAGRPKEYEPIILENNEGEQVVWTPSAGAKLPAGGPWKRVAGGAGTTINISAGERETVAKTEARLTALDDLEDAFETAWDKANESPYRNVIGATGFFSGRAQNMLGAIGMSGREQEDLRAKIYGLQNEVLQAMSGANVSAQESERIKNQVPTELDPPVRFRAKMRATRRNLLTLQQKRREVQVTRPATGTVPADIQNMSDEELKQIAGVR